MTLPRKQTEFLNYPNLIAAMINPEFFKPNLMTAMFMPGRAFESNTISVKGHNYTNLSFDYKMAATYSLLNLFYPILA